MEGTSSFTRSTSGKFVLSLSLGDHGRIITSWRCSTNSRPSPAQEISFRSSFKLPQGRDGGTIAPVNNKVISNSGDHTGGSTTFGSGDSDGGLGEVGGVFSLGVTLVDLNTTEKFILQNDRNNWNGVTLSLANILRLSILGFLASKSCRITRVLVLTSSGGCGCGG